MMWVVTDLHGETFPVDLSCDRLFSRDCYMVTSGNVSDWMLLPGTLLS